MIYFITNRLDHDKFIYKSAKINVRQGYSELIEFLNITKALGYDSEGTGSRIYISELLLIQVGNKETQFVLDCTKEQFKGHITFLNQYIKSNHILFGHNIKYDRNLAAPYNLILKNLFDTMVAEQNLCMGSGLKVNLVDTCARRLKKMMDTDKDTRKDFIYMTNKSATFLVRHIMYAGGDVVDLIDIARIQKTELERRNQYDYVRNIEHYLVEVLSDIELKGVPHNKIKWKKIIEKKQIERFKIEKDLDQEIVTLAKDNIYLKGGKFNTKRRKGVSTQFDLFGRDTEVENKNKHNINYNSGKEILSSIRKAGFKVPVYSSKGEERDSLMEEAIQTYLLENPATPLRLFMTHLLKYKELQKFISSYGPKFLSDLVVKLEGKNELGYRSTFTDRVHTIYKQCFLPTNRLSSGNKKEGYFNSQQLPTDQEIREAFELTPKEIDEGWYITTADLTGAEAIIAAAISGEYKLYELAVIKDDVHSPIATSCWRAIYEYRYNIITKYEYLKSKSKFDLTNSQKNELANLRARYEVAGKFNLNYTIYDTKKKEYTLTKDFLIDKNNNKQLRTDFKPMVFGIFYGLKAKKGGETLNIPPEEAQIAINVVNNTFPLVKTKLDEAVMEAYTTGEVIFNTRSNNRRIFQPVKTILEQIKDIHTHPKRVLLNFIKSKLSFSDQGDIDGAARNCRIQGTQANMIKEAMVRLHQYIKKNNIEAHILMSIHDELVVQHKNKEFGKVIGQIMTDTANKYLEIYSKEIKMTVSVHTGYCWTK